MRLHHNFAGTPESETVLLQALEHMRTQTALQLNKMKQEEQFAEVDWYMLHEYLPEKLVEEMDVQRKTSVHRRLSTLTNSVATRQPTPSRRRNTRIDIELAQVPTVVVSDSVSSRPIDVRENEPDDQLALAIFDFQSADTTSNQNIRDELTLRFLTALSVDYEKQWYLGMIRRRTLYILIKSIEKAKHQKSLRRHWDLIVENFQLSFLLRQLMRFDYVESINKQLNKLLFDHVFLAIELTLGE